MKVPPDDEDEDEDSTNWKKWVIAFKGTRFGVGLKEKQQESHRCLAPLLLRSFAVRSFGSVNLNLPRMRARTKRRLAL